MCRDFKQIWAVVLFSMAGLSMNPTAALLNFALTHHGMKRIGRLLLIPTAPSVIPAVLIPYR
jgi:hypothetical protein